MGPSHNHNIYQHIPIKLGWDVCYNVCCLHVFASLANCDARKHIRHAEHDRDITPFSRPAMPSLRSRSWPVRMFLVKFLHKLGGILKVACRVPRHVLIITCPFSSILEPCSSIARVKDFVYPPLIAVLRTHGAGLLVGFPGR